MNNIPPEILCAVFEHCLTGSRPRCVSSAEAPLLLSQICRRWRDVCLNTSQLWTNVDFGEQGSPELLKLWLLRSGIQPISLCLLTYNNEPRARGLVDVAALHRNRWRDVCLMLPHRVLAMALEYLLPSLRCLELFPLNRTTGSLPVIRIANAYAPMLRRATLSQPTNYQYELPWTQLTDLLISGQATPLSSVTLLRECPNLLHLSHDSPIMDAELVLEHPNPYLHDTLCSLSTQNEWILPYLTLPALQRLDLRPAGGVVENINTDAFLPAFLRRSACELRYLCLSVNTIGQEEFAKILHADATRSVEHLRLVFSNPFREHVGILKSEEVLPKLKYLEVDDWTGPGDHYTGLLATLRLRYAHHSLEACKLFLYARRWQIWPYEARVPSVEVLKSFQELADAGLRLRVMTRELKEVMQTTKDMVLLDRFPSWCEDIYDLGNE
ncbi:hypothetical protein C8F01DRAFT_1120492 [Mycena amicta]|nr:hypothetical protein C8F01DRAFT_1120492 [Mycena amicta]